MPALRGPGIANLTPWPAGLADGLALFCERLSRTTARLAPNNLGSPLPGSAFRGLGAGEPTRTSGAWEPARRKHSQAASGEPRAWPSVTGQSQLRGPVLRGFTG